MKVSEFSTLLNDEQLAHVRNEGVYVGKRIANGQKVVLYQVHSFYVEIAYRVYRRIISRITISGDVRMLDLYPEQLDMGM